MRTSLPASGLTAVLPLLVVAASCAKSSEPPAPSATATAVATPSSTSSATVSRPSDTVQTSLGPLRIVPLHHATVLFQFGGKAIYADPVKDVSYDDLPKADVVLITDIHPDHLDPGGLDKVKKPDTIVVAPPAVADKLPPGFTGTVVIKNGETKTVSGLGVEAIPMYNLKRGPAAGQLYHDKGRGDGYVVTFGDKRVYLSGDTECIDEMKALKNIDVAFVCMNLPYTMPPAEAAECIKAFKPKVLYPYHFRDSNLDELTSVLKGEPTVEVRMRKWY
jgi:L-ascorbate metabolism protein UlaG (beta-lactamase superfamily)